MRVLVFTLPNFLSLLMFSLLQALYFEKAVFSKSLYSFGNRYRGAAVFGGKVKCFRWGLVHDLMPVGERSQYWLKNSHFAVPIFDERYTGVLGGMD